MISWDFRKRILAPFFSADCMQALGPFFCILGPHGSRGRFTLISQRRKQGLREAKSLPQERPVSGPRVWESSLGAGRTASDLGVMRIFQGHILALSIPFMCLCTCAHTLSSLLHPPGDLRTDRTARKHSYRWESVYCYAGPQSLLYKALTCI